MTRKDFQLIADALKDSKPTTGEARAIHDQWNLTVSKVTDSLATTNPRFDRKAFVKACG
jgi:hypothetical protein